MIRATKVLTTLSFLSLLLLILSSASYAGVLDGNGAAYNGWTGTSPYTNGLAAPNNLDGTIDYAVFTAADFIATFPGSTYAPGDALVYAYQVNNAGTFAASLQIVGISNPANTIGQFENAVGEIESSLLGFDLDDNALWNFTAPLIGTNESSYILTFSSEKIPIMGTGVSVTVDGGTFGITDVPTPGPISIPEPASLLMLAAGLLGFVTRRCR
jgi:hypothetical protein